ncbi:MAG: methyltransferase domain-containing protein [Pseudomonadota bacterium]|nr:methyltransferase domain-containing protein [Pseudomonadota bacterium]
MKWNSSLYDQKHSFVFKYGEEVLALLNPQRGERILDVGCGTGHLTKLIAEAGAKVVGIDNSPEMIEAARAASPDIDFVVADAADFSFTEPFDAVFSNAALHWVTEAERAVVCMARSLKQGGRFVIELGGKGNIAAITRAVREAIWEVLQVKVEHGRYYPSVSEYSGLLERHGLLVRSAVLFDRPTKLEAGEQGLRNWIAMFDQDVMSNVRDDKKEQVIRKVEDKTRCILFVDGYWFADYRRLRMVAHKE